MVTIAIDGASRRNGKPDCISAGGVYVVDHDQGTTMCLSLHEYNSTNQRGEMMALLKAFDFIHSNKQMARIVTDSEYLFNTITKDWINAWNRKGWVTAIGEPVKNQDLWRCILHVHNAIVDKGIEFTMYHVRGHVIPMGKVLGSSLLNTDLTGRTLWEATRKKAQHLLWSTEYAGKLQSVQDCSIKNNGFEMHPEVILDFVAANTVADFIATIEVDRINSEYLEEASSVN